MPLTDRPWPPDRLHSLARLLAALPPQEEPGMGPFSSPQQELASLLAHPDFQSNQYPPPLIDSLREHVELVLLCECCLKAGQILRGRVPERDLPDKVLEISYQTVVDLQRAVREYRAAFSTGDDIRAYLYRICSRKAVDAFRRARRQPATASLDKCLVGKKNPLLVAFELQEETAWLLSRLYLVCSPPEKQVLDLLEDGLSPEDIGKQLGFSRDYVYQLRHRIRIKAKVILLLRDGKLPEDISQETRLSIPEILHIRQANRGNPRAEQRA